MRDSGMEIGAETLKRMFDPFFTTKPEGQGTGPGRSLSFGFVTRHGGRIEVESEPGAGTTRPPVISLPAELPGAAG